MIPTHQWRMLIALVLASVHPSPATAQVPVTDSTAVRRHLAVHVPFFIPFFHHRHHAGSPLVAEPDTTDVLSFEAGYDGNFHSPELARDETSSITAVVTPMSRLELQADLDFWASELAPRESAVRGRGDAHIRAQWTAFTRERGDVAVALAWIVKLPVASQGSLGTGWVDHRLLVPVSFAFRGMQVDAYAGADADGGPTRSSWGTEEAANATISLAPRLSMHVGISAQALDTDQPAGRYVSGGFTWQVRPLVALDLGARMGISPRAPSFGLTAGMTTAIITKQK